MPTYDYECQKCKHHFVLITKIDDRNIAETEPCPECQEVAVEKLMTAPGFADPVRIGIRRPDGGFSEVLQKIHHSNRGSDLHNSRYI
jgi:putative FmdB family regulatory protein